MASRRITQETFDAVVRENLEEFDLDESEALKEAIEQFESQGVDLSYIVKVVPKVCSEENAENQTHEVLQVLESLKSASSASVLEDLRVFTQQCSLGFAQRFLAAQKEAYPTILACCQRAAGEKEALSVALAALSALTDGQPDLLDAEGREFMIGVLTAHQKDAALSCLCFRLVRNFCVKHENNRQNLVKAGVLPLLTASITRHIQHPEVVREACVALRVMTFDDDVRVAFGSAHEHARMIVQEHNGLKVIVEAAKAHPENPSVLSELCGTLSRLAVRDEFCQDIVDLGGLRFMITLLADSLDRPELVKQVLRALKAIAGNDDVKDAIVNGGGAELIVMAMNRHMTNAQVCEQGCAALCVLALRKPNNCKAIVECGGALASVQAMKNHPDKVNVQTQSCMLLRNLVAHTRDFSPLILDMGAEALILQALAAHRDCADVGRAALRDLGCQVELRELWTGKKGSLSH
ncbi:armadillo repeat-containing protein 6-like [Carassius auratus]|uniref:Armadillo repeat-containing protein 6-like n=1 Tax=Carassius auratus TaxID=7957 RepID=A0A6P6QGX1_CARAU|nr:armadillo repeat-containing protein 6-like [Carassius auratus]XP_026132533.1 armadillo repeat-containing protein 6-like [Carassius auratus]XP_026132542.1 armadillo repeat-containing protein 6-like [Carassius auratus]